MNKVSVKLEHCYGISKLEHVFDFEKSAISIYAQNGSMKTSFAKTFRDISKEVASKDLMFPQRNTVREVSDETGAPLEPSAIFVIDPYDKEYKSDKMSTLLVNKGLRERYDQAHLKIDETKDILVKALKPQCGLKGGVEDAISEAFTFTVGQLFTSLERVRNEVLDKSEAEFSDVIYKNIFNDKVVKFLETKGFKEKIKAYINTYDELLDSSSYFKKGIFNHNNAATIAKNLADNGFFKAKHSVSLNAEKDSKVIADQTELEDVIEKEKESILNDPALAQAFNEIDIKIKANSDLREFRDYLLKNSKVLPELGNLQNFKQKLWISYLKTSKDIYTAFLEVYLEGKKELEATIDQAKAEKTGWIEVLEIFNERFSVPFRLEVNNQDDVILKRAVPSIKFAFKEKDEETKVEESDLLQALSNGEKRSLYILNIIFEVEARKKAAQNTLFIMDDVADSFDYKNKYAIIEYLKEIAKEDFFNQILLTHNFDFFRTLESRFVGREQSYMITKTAQKIELIGAEYLKPFSYFKNNLHMDDHILIASIPFIRNLAEYTNSSQDENFLKLTSVLHVKEDTCKLTIKDLQITFNNVIEKEVVLQNTNRKVLDLIFELADNLIQTQDGQVNLENKIVLAIAIRLKAELFMISKVTNKEKIATISKNQTAVMFELYKDEFGTEEVSLKLLEQVNLMTPENIHFNSFMYEPILDMSDEHLKQLYSRLLELD